MPSAVEGRVLVASGNPYAASPSWERIDMLGNCRCPGFDIATGRSTILERTDMGTARVYFNDRDLVLDTDDLVGQAILLQAYNPVLDTWEEQFRGVVDEPNFDVHNS